MVGIDERIRGSKFYNFRGNFNGEKRRKLTHMNIKPELFGRFCSNFDMWLALMKISGILNFKIFAANLVAKNGESSQIWI